MPGDDAKGKGGRPKSAGRCPICGKPTEAAYRPFCSAHCRDVDLARWLGGGYAIAGAAPGMGDDDEAGLPESSGSGTDADGDGGDGGD